MWKAAALIMCHKALSTEQRVGKEKLFSAPGGVTTRMKSLTMPL